MARRLVDRGRDPGAPHRGRRPAAVLGDVGAGGGVAPPRATRSPRRRPRSCLLVVGAGAVLWRPGRVGPLVVLAVGGVVTMWSEAPVLGNHWLLAALVDLALLFAVAVGVVRRRWSDATDLADRFLPVARLVPARLLLLRVVRQAQLGVLRPVGELRHLLLPTSPPTRVGLSALQLDGAAGLEWAVIVAHRRDRAVDPVAVGVPSHAAPRRGRGTRLPRRAGARQDAPVLRLLVGAGRPLRALPPRRPSVCGWPSGWARSGPGCSSGTSVPQGGCTSASSTLPVLAGMAVVFDLLTPQAGPAGGLAALAGVRGAAPRRARSGSCGSARRSRTGGPCGWATSVFLLVPLLVFVPTG